MKNILVPTDFSICAGYAEDLALQLADKCQGHLSFLHNTPHIPDGWADLTAKEQDALYAEDPTLQVLKESWDKINRDVAQNGLSATFHLTSGRLWQSVNRVVQNAHIDLVVMGSHGSSGSEELFIGSNTQKVVRKALCDVLILKSQLKSIRFKKVVFASALNLSERPVFAKLLEILRHLDAEEIHILSVNTPGFYSQPSILIHESLEDFAAMATDFHCQTHFISDLTVEGGIRHFNEKINADLITISNHEKRPLRRMLVGSNVELLVNHAKAPVLAIDLPVVATSLLRSDKNSNTNQKG